MENFSDTQITMTINDASKLVGVSTTTLRNWEKAGLITPTRKNNRYRLYTGADIHRLKEIKELSIEKGISLPAIHSLLSKNYTHNTHAGVTRGMLGDKWQKHRLKKGLSVSEVAEQIGISPSYLAKIEAAQANVSYDILEKLAHFYGENPLYYFKPNFTKSPHVCTGDEETFTIGLEGVTLSSRSTLPEAEISPMIYDIEPLCGRMASNSHHGEEFVYVLTGTMEYTLNDKEIYLLNEGESIHYFSITPHKWRNPSKTKNAKILWTYVNRGEV
jgi:DNA-binding transcriptional MerR regulator/quercetin dioxygenase-like cupin family protein